MEISNNIKNYLNNNTINILICTPCYNNQLFLGYHRSMLKLVNLFTQINLRYEIMDLGQESLITRARNGMLSKFIADENYTHLIFIDADITFDALDILKLLAYNKPIVGGIYPKKAINFDKLKKYILENPDSSNVLPHALDYNLNVVLNKENNEPICEGNLIQVHDLATGFMLFNRSVVDALIYKFPNLQYHNNCVGYDLKNNKDCFYTFFNAEVVDNIYLSEDYYFCHLVKKSGIKIFCDPYIKLTHSGNIDYEGGGWELSTHSLDPDRNI